MYNLKNIIYRMKDLKKNKHKGWNCMRSGNAVNPFLQGMFSVQIDGETFPGTSLIPEWKLDWIGKKVSPAVLCQI